MTTMSTSNGPASQADAEGDDASPLSDIQSFIYLVTFPSGSDFSMTNIETEIGASPYQLVILDFNAQNGPLDRTLADPNHNKIILGYLAAGFATQNNDPDLFASASLPSYFGNTQPGWPAVYSVQYWNPAWEQELFSQIDKLIAEGYNGVFLDGAPDDTMWTAGNPEGNPVNPNATADIAHLFSDIRTYIASKHLSQPFYMVANGPSSLAQSDPSALSNFDAIFNEGVFYQTIQPGGASTPTTTIANDPSGVAAFTNVIAPDYAASGLPLFGSDYPDTSNLAQDFMVFAEYSALGWVPSAVYDSDATVTLVNGPYMAVAVAGNSTVKGNLTLMNFLGGGSVASATLIGGNQGNYFLGGPGQNIIQGGGGTDIIYAHPAAAGLKGVLDISYTSTNENSANPFLEILVNGQIALVATKVISDATGTNLNDLQVNIGKFGTISSIEFLVTVTPATDSTHFANVVIRSLSYQGVSIPLSDGVWSNNIDNAGLFNIGDTASFAGSDFTSSYPSDTSDTITGGTGMNTVVYRADYANYTITPQSNGTLLVTSAATPEGPDTLTNIQHLQFTDGTLVRETAAQVAGELDTLQSIATSSGLIAIDLTDSGTPTLTIAASQLSSDAAAIKAISGSFSLSETAPAASATIVGAANALGNTLVLSGAASDYTITSQGDGVHLNVSGNGASDTVSDIQALQFADHTDIVAAPPGPANAVTTGNITELYSAVLAREPDLGGLTFYQNYLKSNPATPLQQFADYFLSSTEYVSAHNYAQSTAGDTQFIEDSYQNLLHRTPSADEVNFYLTNVMEKAEANLTPGTAAFASAQFQAHALMLVYFSASAEFLSDVQVTAANPTSAQHWLVLI